MTENRTGFAGEAQRQPPRLSSDLCSLSSDMVGLGRFELPTSRLSGVRSNQLSYRPVSEHSEQMTENRNALCKP